MRFDRIGLVWAFMLLAVSIPCRAEFDRAKSWEDPGDRSAFLVEMKKRGIAHRVDDQGRIWYSREDDKRVEEVSREIRAKGEFPGVSFHDPIDDVRFRDLLQAAGIPFSTRTYLGQEWFTWEKRFDSAAKRIADQVEDENMARARARREASKSRPRN